MFELNQAFEFFDVDGISTKLLRFPFNNEGYIVFPLLRISVYLINFNNPTKKNVSN